jgi:hypothetical protein
MKPDGTMEVDVAETARRVLAMSTLHAAINVVGVEEGWHAPGYRDTELQLNTAAGPMLVKLSPNAFVQLLDILCTQQDVIDRSGEAALDGFPYRSLWSVQRRAVQ